HPAGASSRHRLRRLRLRSRRPLPGTLLLYGTTRLGWPAAAKRVAPRSGPEKLAGNARAAFGHLYRRTLHRPLGLVKRKAPRFCGLGRGETKGYLLIRLIPAPI